MVCQAGTARRAILRSPATIRDRTRLNAVQPDHMEWTFAAQWEIAALVRPCGLSDNGLSGIVVVLFGPKNGTCRETVAYIETVNGERRRPASSQLRLMVQSSS